METAAGAGRPRNSRGARVLLLAVACALLLGILSSIPVRAPPPLPMVVRGHAYDSAGAPLPPGTPIRAFIDGVQYSNDSTVIDLSGAFAITVYGNYMLNGTTPETPNHKEGANAGETVWFAAGDFTNATSVFQESVAWFTNALVTQDLHLGSTATTPLPLKIQALVPQPAMGGVAYVLLCNPSSTAASLADYYLETDVAGSYYGPNVTLSGPLAPSTIVRANASISNFVDPRGDALKLVYRNPGGAGASAGGHDIVVDRLEYNGTRGGTLDWEPGNTTLGTAPAPGIGRILERSPACVDTNSPADFRVANEPGVPTGTQPTLTITVPTPSQIVDGGQPWTIRWTMADPGFASQYLQVWVNVTYGGTTVNLLAGASGATNVTWDVPAVEVAGAAVQVHAVNPFGGNATASAGFSIRPPSLYLIIVAVLIVAVVLVFLALAWRNVRKRSAAKESPQAPPPAAPQPPGPPPSVAAPEPAAPNPPGTKICPRCHTTVRAEDYACFFCGHVFSGPPP